MIAGACAAAVMNARALMVVVDVMTNGPVYTFDDSVGIDPSTV